MVNAYNICYDKNEKIFPKSRTLREYSQFIHYVNENLDEGITFEYAVETTVWRAMKADNKPIDEITKYTDLIQRGNRETIITKVH